MKFNIPEIKMKYPTYIVGGWVRDKVIDPSSCPKDIDLAMVAPDFKSMREAVIAAGGEIYLETPQYLTIRCMIPELGAVDVALTRTDGEYTDGRRPDETHITDSIEDDLSRRDFTCNAIAVDVSNGHIVDPFGGVADAQDKILRTVRNARSRFEEDYLRLFRALRFAITKEFSLDCEIVAAMHDREICSGIKNISKERIREEMLKCFNHNTFTTVGYLNEYSNLLYWMCQKGVSLKPTLEKLKV